jgi:sucrose-6F-phosphate phosphohydrolase
LLVVYVTGRNLRLTEDAITEFGIRYPDVLIGDVGTSIRRYERDSWVHDEGWNAYVAQANPRWDADALRGALADIPGLTEQAREHCGPFKQSYYVDAERKADVLALVDDRSRDRFDETVVYSFDPEADTGLLDFLPRSANKQTALEYLADNLGVSRSEVVFCGDSGNDVQPLTADFSGVLVRNADEQLVASVNQASDANPALKVYFAQGGFKGLSGYYTSGVIEGAFHYGLFGETE